MDVVCFSNGLPESLRWSYIYIFLFWLLIWRVTLMDFWMLTQLCISGINSIWSSHIILMLLYLIWNYFAEDFCIYIHGRHLSLSFLLCLCLVSQYCWPHLEELESIHTLSVFCKSLCRMVILPSVFGKIHQWSLLCLECFMLFYVCVCVLVGGCVTTNSI